MDSLMGAEIEKTLERGYDLLLGVEEVRRLTFGKLRSIGAPPANGTPEKPIDQPA